MMKRVMLFFIVGVVFVGGVFGNGISEEKSISIPMAGNKKENFKVVINPSYGNLHIQLIPTRASSSIRAWAIRIDNDLGSDTNERKYFASNYFYIANAIDTGRINNLLDTRPNEIASDISLTDYGIDIHSYSFAQVNLNNLGDKVTVVGEFSVDDFGKNTEIEFIFLYAENNCLYVKAQVIPAFFPGERELFATSDKTYKENCYSFLNNFFTITQAPPQQYSESLTQVFGDTESTTFDYAGKENEYFSGFKKALAANFKTEYEEREYQIYSIETLSFNMPYLDFSLCDTYDLLYGTEQNNYISTYIWFLYKLNKPLLSNIIQKKLYDENLSRNIPDLYYDHNKYSVINSGEAVPDELLLSDYALRYLSWGVEYTPYNATGNIQAGYAGNEVYNDYYNDVLANWLEGNNDTRMNNYLNTEIGQVNSFINESTENPMQIQVFETNQTTSKVKVVGRLETGKTRMELANAYFWTSRNIAWDDGRVNPFYKVGNGNPSYLDAMKIIDKKIKYGVEDNVKIDRGTAANTIEAGFTFRNPEDVGALCFMRGTAAIPVRSPYSENMFELYYLEDGNDEWKLFDKSKVTQYIVLEDGDGKNYPRIKKINRFCFSLYYDRYSINNRVTITYLLLDKTYSNWKGVKLVDNCGNEYLNLTEVLVFPENPIDYVDGYPDQIDIGIVDTYIKPYPHPTLLYRCDPGKYSWFSESDNINEKGTAWFDVIFNKSINLKMMAFYEANAVPDTPSTMYKESFMLLFGSSDLGNAIYYTDNTALLNLNTIFSKITTPFYIDKDTKANGNPLPYVPFGIDSPRTFNYKMHQQKITRDWFYGDQFRPWIIPSTSLTTTKAYDILSKTDDYKNIYVSEIDIYSKALGFNLQLGSDFHYITYNNTNPPKDENNNILKPYIPGYYVNSKDGYISSPDSLSCPDKTTGIDAIGLLMGSLSMYKDPATGKYVDVVNIFNKNITNELNKYYSMTESAPGLTSDQENNRYVPAFYTNVNDSLLNGYYRLARSDMEKNTIIIPDLLEVRKGDIVINYDIEGEPHIGIVVLVEEPGENEDPREKIYVISIRKGFQMTLLGTWGNPDGLFGGFTTDPDKYHVRRLLKLDGVQVGYDMYQDWEAVKEYLVALDCTLKLPPDPYTKTPNHWIPNTGEYLSEFEVTIEAVSQSGNMTVPENMADILLEGPKDPHYNEGREAETGKDIKVNIRCNKGTGIKFYAVPNPGEEPKYLATFERKEPGENEELDEDNVYNVTYNLDPEDGYFEIGTSGIQCKEGTRLYVNESKLLCFENSAGNINTKLFAVNAYGTMRPGDDFQLGFKLAKDQTVKGTVKEDGFMGVYDKKLLWRANLYVDERLNEDGSLSNKVDWNDKHYWNQSDPELPHFNEWQNAGSVVPGGQVEIKPWRHPQGDFYWWTDIANGSWFHWQIPSRIVTNSVSYGGPVAPEYNGTGDECPEYQRKLGEQITALETAGKINPPDNWANYENSSYVPSVGFYNVMQSKTNWVIFGKFTAVEFQNQILGKIINENDKIFVQSMYKEKAGIYYLRNFIPEDAGEKGKLQEPISEEDRKKLTTILDGIEYTHPTINGIRDMRLRNTIAEQEQHDMGVVCDSFIYRSRMYKGNNYVVEKPNYLPRVVYDYWALGEKQNTIEGAVNKLTGELHYLVPGDVVHFTGHIGIVRLIEYSNGRKTAIDKVWIIHSTTLNDKWMVRNEHTVKDFLNIDDSTIGRMKED